MKKFILGLAIALTMVVATPALAEEVQCEDGETLNSQGECVAIQGGAPMFHFPRVQDTFYNHGNVLGFLGNKFAVGHLYIGESSVPFARDTYGVARTAMLFNDGVPFLTENPLQFYTHHFVDFGGVSYHTFEKPEGLLPGTYFVRGCIDSIFGRSCGNEYQVNI